MKPIHLIPLANGAGPLEPGSWCWSIWRPRWRARSARRAASGRRRSTWFFAGRGPGPVLFHGDSTAPGARFGPRCARAGRHGVRSLCPGADLRVSARRSWTATARWSPRRGCRRSSTACRGARTCCASAWSRRRSTSLGHTFGLRHCADWRCVMASSHAVERLDVKGVEFCRTCRKSVFGNGYSKG